MHHSAPDPATMQLDRTVEALGPNVLRWPLIVGIVGLVAAVITAFVRPLFVVGENGIERLMYSYLTSYMFFLSITLGALFFVMVQHVTRAGWSVTVRRVAEILAANILYLALLFIPILVCVLSGTGVLYRWTSSVYMHSEELLEHKLPYLNIWRFTGFALVYFGLWYFLANGFYRRSLEQDATGDAGITNRFEGRAAWGLLVTFLTVSFAAIDWLMTLDPTWFSTIFGVYYIMGGVMAFFATMWVIVYILQSQGLLTDAVTVEHQHDLGKGVFFSLIFWTYIAFSQYLLIWYGDIPEETQWYLHRQMGTSEWVGGWQWIGVALIFGHFIIPFFGLMSRHVKRNRKALLFWCVWLLVMHWMDMYYLAMPEIAPGKLPFGLIDIFCFVGIGGLTTAGLLRTAGAHALVPVRDPRLAESLAFHNI